MFILIYFLQNNCIIKKLLNSVFAISCVYMQRVVLVPALAFGLADKTYSALIILDITKT